MGGGGGTRFYRVLNSALQPYGAVVKACKWKECVKIIENLLEGAKEYGLEFIKGGT